MATEERGKVGGSADGGGAWGLPAGSLLFVAKNGAGASIATMQRGLVAVLSCRLNGL